MWDREGTASLARMLAESAAGKGGGLFLAGEPGSGKSALLELARREHARSFQVGWGQADPVELSVPLSLFGQVFRKLATNHVPEPNGELTSALRTSRADAYHLALEFLERAAAVKPVLVVLDDMHWADADSLAFLAFLWRRMDRIPVAILGGFRPWPPAAKDAAHRLPGGDRSVVRLPRLGAAEISRLVEQRTHRRATPEEVAAILAQSRGNALLVEEILVHHRAGSPIDVRVENWRRSDLRELAARYVGDDPAEQAVAAAASVFGERFRPALAIRSAGLDRTRAGEALEALYQAGIVEPLAGGTARFVHPLVHRVVYASLGPNRRAELHVRAMRALIDHGVAVSDAAEHAILAEASGDPGAVDVLAEAGRTTLEAGDLVRARRFLEAGIAMAANGARPRLKFMLGQVLLASGELTPALGLFRELGALRDGSLAGLGARWTARALFVRGETEEADQAIDMAIRGAESSGDGTGAARARVDRAAMALWTLGPSTALAVCAADTGQGRPPTGRLASAAAAVLACARYGTGDPAGLPVIESLTREAARHAVGEVGPLMWGYGVLGACLHTAQLAELYDDADAAFDVIFDSAQRLELPAGIASLAIARAGHLCLRGRIGEAMRLAETAVSAAERAPGYAVWARGVQAEVLFEAGGAASAAGVIRAAQDRAVGGAPPVLRALLNHVTAMTAFESSRPALASELFERVERDVEAAGIIDPSAIRWAVPAVGAHLAAGRPDAAKRVVRWLEQGAARLPAALPRALLAAARASVAEAEGDVAAAESGFDEALAILRPTPLRLVLIKTLIARGRLLRIEGRVRAARAPLVEAVEAAREAGAGRLEAMARQEMGISGARFRQHRDPSHLTPQENRVATLARMGLSDRDIAGKLFISQKTVETHLMRIYRKLEVANRRQLMILRQP